MKSTKAIESSAGQYGLSVFAVIVVAGACYPFSELIGYRTVSLLLLLTVSVLAMRFGIGPVTLAAILSALMWDYLFIPPHFTFTVDNAEDALMLTMYFIIALLNGVLTYQLRQYERIVQRREHKERALRLYNTLFNSLSHELRTPIATILAASDNLLSETEHSWSVEDRLNMTQEIHRAGERLNRLVDNLLNVSRLESGHVVLKWDWCDVGELITTATKRLKNDLQQRRIQLQIPENMPLVRLDFVLMEQALFNLLHNATIYTDKNALITIRAEYRDREFVLEIADNGPGFLPEDLNRVFEKFYRPKGSKAGGTGLGLSIVRGVVEAHQGSIVVKNRPEGGAQFILKIPTGSLPNNSH